VEQENKHKVGSTVYAKVNPEIKLIARKYSARKYYCTFASIPMKKELALFEREIESEKSITE
jgi:hypothetical protein